jgi:hypothetical protein
MTAALSLSALVIAFVSVTGFLIGPLFAGKFWLPALIAGLAGLPCALAAVRMAARPSWSAAWVHGSGMVALVAVAIDAAHYYVALDFPGNYYGWGLIGPYCACLTLVAHASWRRGAAAKS